jgi:hypothetical protein
LYPWIGKYNITQDEIRFIEPLLKKLNYDFDINMNFTADSIVIENDKKIKENKDYWEKKGIENSDHIKRFISKNNKWRIFKWRRHQ